MKEITIVESRMFATETRVERDYNDNDDDHLDIGHFTRDISARTYTMNNPLLAIQVSCSLRISQDELTSEPVLGG